MSIRETWDQLDLAMLQDWVTNKRQEGLHLDFKQLTSAPKVTRDDRKIFASAASGFANSDGGIIVWGVEAIKDADGVDAAQALKPLADPKAVLSALQSHTGDAVSPSVNGVDHKLIEDGNGKGFIATIVPESDRGPHMAGLGESRYYKRNGDSFIKMEHFDVADMFGRRARAVLALRVLDQFGPGMDDAGAIYQPIIAVENTGRGAAKFPFLRAKLSQGYSFNREFGLRGGQTGLPEQPQFDLRVGAVFAGGADHAIHPGTCVQIQRLKAPRGLSRNTNPAHVADLSLTIEYELACDGVPLQTGTLTRSATEIVTSGIEHINSR